MEFQCDSEQIFSFFRSISPISLILRLFAQIAQIVDLLKFILPRRGSRVLRVTINLNLKYKYQIHGFFDNFHRFLIF